MTEQQPQPRACTSCGGAGGRTVDTSDGETTRQHWQTCSACGGTGTQGGGV